MTITRRSYLLEPGEELLLSRSAITVAERFDRFCTDSGLDPDQVFSDPLCATPLPIARKNPDGTIPRWRGVNPAFLWHPVMWLPRDIALRYQVREDPSSDELHLETDHEWAIRVSLELQAAGLYDSETGGWLDVLALHGLDPANPVDYARIEAWLGGGADETLDAIDLRDFTASPDDPDWAFRATRELAEALIPAQWSLIAGDLLDVLSESAATGGSLEVRQRTLAAISGLAWDVLEDVPDSGELLASICEELEEVGTDVEDAGRRLRGVLASVRDDYRPAVTAFNEGSF